MWTAFMDMHSGGGTKEGSFERIYIEAPEEEAHVIFYNRFGHSPSRVSCTCCGEDYSTTMYDTLEEAMASAGARPTLVIPASDIRAAERVGTVPEQGYVWHDD